MEMDCGNLTLEKGGEIGDDGTLIMGGGTLTFEQGGQIREGGTLVMGGGTLTLEQGGEIRDGGELDLSNSILELSGPFYNSQGTGTLTTSASTLRLNSNVQFEHGHNAAFDTYEPNGW